MNPSPDRHFSFKYSFLRFQLQRESSSTNQKRDDDDYDVVDFGDGEKVVIGAKQGPVSTVSISILIVVSLSCMQTIGNTLLIVMY